VTERFLASDPPTAAELGRAEAAVLELLEAAIAEQPHLARARRLVGLAGTVTTLSSLQMGLDEYERDRVHHSVLTLANAYDWYHTLAAEVRQARLDRAGMVSGREDVIVGGAMILATVMTRFGFDECLVSEADILDGMVAGLLAG
jgi:exopolyphosphatase/guanosine-5'-triphosphate,3'-diphosphate pyrophosphatase